MQIADPIKASITNGYDVLHQLEENAKVTNTPMLPYSYKGGATYCSMTPLRDNIVYGNSLHNTECITWHRCDDHGKPILFYDHNPNKQDINPSAVSTISYLVKPKAKQWTQKVLLQNHVPDLYQLDLRDFLWKLTRRIALWDHDPIFYAILMDRENGLLYPINKTHRRFYSDAVPSRVLPACGRHNCINPQHLTLVHGTWLPYTFIPEDRKPPTLAPKEWLDIVERSSKRMLSVGARKEFKQWLPKNREFWAAKLPVGSSLFCDNFLFRGFTDLLKAPHNHPDLDAPRSRSKVGMGMARYIWDLEHSGCTSVGAAEELLEKIELARLQVSEVEIEGLRF